MIISRELINPNIIINGMTYEKICHRINKFKHMFLDRGMNKHDSITVTTLNCSTDWLNQKHKTSIVGSTPTRRTAAALARSSAASNCRAHFAFPYFKNKTLRKLSSSRVMSPTALV